MEIQAEMFVLWDLPMLQDFPSKEGLNLYTVFFPCFKNRTTTQPIDSPKFYLHF